MPQYIPSPSVNGFYVGPAFIHVYGLMYVVGITLAILITQRRWKAVGGDPGLVGDVAIWAVPAGIIGGRIYFDLTTPQYIPHHWYGVFAVWDGGLGIWGGIALGALVGVWRVRRHFHGLPRGRSALVAPEARQSAGREAGPQRRDTATLLRRSARRLRHHGRPVGLGTRTRPTGLRSIHAPVHPQPGGQWLSRRPGVHPRLRADVRGRDHAGDPDHAAPVEGRRR